MCMFHRWQLYLINIFNVIDKQKQDDIDANAHDGPLQEGDVARRRDFESLVSVETKKTLGPIGAAQLVPWVPPFLSNYMIVLADPRRQSRDLRKSVQYLASSPGEVLSQLIVINADSVEETSK